MKSHRLITHNLKLMNDMINGIKEIFLKNKKEIKISKCLDLEKHKYRG